MLDDAVTTCQGLDCRFHLTDGIHIPVEDSSLSGVFCCGVLRYSLLVDDPCYEEIGREFMRCIKPGGYVVNCELYVDVPPQQFVEGFEKVGLSTERVSVINRYSFLERVLSNRFLPTDWLPRLGSMNAAIRSVITAPRDDLAGLRDYLFVWQKPAV